jgi:hypothetical protein
MRSGGSIPPLATILFRCIQITGVGTSESKLANAINLVYFNANVCIA